MIQTATEEPFFFASDLRYVFITTWLYLSLATGEVSTEGDLHSAFDLKLCNPRKE
jgi:hypothetical protein